MKKNELFIPARLLAFAAAIAVAATAKIASANAGPPPSLLAIIPALSVQGEVSVEPPISSHSSLFVGAGVSGAFMYVEELFGVAQAEIEWRIYFAKGRHAGWSFEPLLIGAYIFNYEWWALMPGFRFSYKKQFNPFFAIEPFLGYLVPFYYDPNSDHDAGFVYGYAPGAHVGLRIYFQIYSPARRRKAGA